ncbi:MAG: amidohydrolase family protein [Clostridia bacterium]
MNRTLIKNIRMIDSEITQGSLLLENGKILSHLPLHNEVAADTVIDGKGLYASAGFIEMHTHGAGGYDFMDGTQQAYQCACDAHLTHGVTTILPTTVAASCEEYHRTLDAFRLAKKSRSNRQCLLGMHFEGPYFPENRAGGMDMRYISKPIRSDYMALIEYACGNIARWSAAPELEGAEMFGDDCVKNGILPSIAHTDGTIRDVRRAVQHGFRHVTHLYSDMSTITRESGFRVLGVLESAYALENLWVELIADGCHLPPDLFSMIYRLIGPERLQLCSDSIRPAGTDAKEAIVGSLENGVRGIIEDGVAKFPDRSAFYGSIAMGSDLVRAARDKAGAPLCAAVRMITENPAKILHIDDHKGFLRVGYDADIVLFDENVMVQQVLYQGKVVV